jgi:hypothetical protein
MIRKIALAALVGAFSLGIAACEKQGPAEQVGEEVDEAVDTVKHGEESVGTKVDDAVDHAREDAKEIGEAAKSD